MTFALSRMGIINRSQMHLQVKVVLGRPATGGLHILYRACKRRRSYTTETFVEP
jgi:hypothetical protein